MLITKKSQSAVVDYPEHRCLVLFGRGIRKLEPMFFQKYSMSIVGAFYAFDYNSPSVLPFSVNIYSAWHNISLLRGGISIKLGTNNHHVSGSYWRGFLVQMSRRQNVRRQRDTVRQFAVADDLVSFNKRADYTVGTHGRAGGLWSMRIDIGQL